MKEKKSSLQAALLIVISIASTIITFGLSILMARLLGPDGFHEYLVAVAALSLLGTISELGTGKYAMKIVPQYCVRRDWSLASGFWRFSFLSVLFASFAITIVVVASEFWSDGQFGNHLLGIAILFLPSTALVAAVSEFVLANRAAIKGSIVTRLVCPLGTLVLVLVFYGVNGSLTPFTAMISFGVAGLIGLGTAVGFFIQSSPKQALTSNPTFKTTSWLRHCAWYLVLAFLMSWIFDISVVVLELADVDELEIARFGAAATTGCFILLVAKSTNKLYQPALSIIMNDSDWNRAVSLRRKRWMLVGSASLAFILVIVFFGKWLLRMYGPEYEAAHLSLCFITFGACVSTVFSMAPEYLKFSEKITTVMLITCVGGLLLIVLTWVLGTNYGATGAGLALGLVTTLMAVTYYVFAHRLLSKSIRSNLGREERDVQH